MTAANKNDRKTTTPSEHSLREQAAIQGLELSKVRGTPNEWLLSHLDDRTTAPFSMLPSLEEVAACLRREPWAIKAFTPRLLRPVMEAIR